MRLLFLLLLLVSPLIAQDKAVIEKRLEIYVKSYNTHDAKSMASFWTEDGQFIHPETGQVIQGKTAIEDFFKRRFQANQDIQLDVKISSVTFKENEAQALGVFHVKQSQQPIQEIAFKAYFEENKGEWLIDQMRQIDIAAVPDHYQHLKELEWLIGDWIDADDDVEIQLSYAWDSTKNFIYKKFTMTTEGKVELEGTQIIGWDPIQNRIRSWFFDTDGTFGEANWKKKGTAWLVENRQVLADGRRGSSVHVITPVDADSYSWEGTNREAGGQILPDIGPIKIIRKKGVAS